MIYLYLFSLHFSQIFHLQLIPSSNWIITCETGAALTREFWLPKILKRRHIEKILLCNLRWFIVIFFSKLRQIDQNFLKKGEGIGGNWWGNLPSSRNWRKLVFLCGSKGFNMSFIHLGGERHYESKVSWPRTQCIARLLEPGPPGTLTIRPLRLPFLRVLFIGRIKWDWSETFH